MVINRPHFNVVVSQEVERLEDREREWGTSGQWRSQDTYSIIS